MQTSMITTIKVIDIPNTSQNFLVSLVHVCVSGGVGMSRTLNIRTYTSFMKKKGASLPISGLMSKFIDLVFKIL